MSKRSRVHLSGMLVGRVPATLPRRRCPIVHTANSGVATRALLHRFVALRIRQGKPREGPPPTLFFPAAFHQLAWQVILFLLAPDRRTGIHRTRDQETPDGLCSYRGQPSAQQPMSAHTTLNQTDNLSTCYVPVSRIRTIINLFEAYESKGSLTKRDWDILSALKRIFTNGKGIKFMQLSVADVALSYDAFKRIKELGVKRNKDHWLFFEDSEGRNTMDPMALTSIVNSSKFAPSPASNGGQFILQV